MNDPKSSNFAVIAALIVCHETRTGCIMGLPATTRFNLSLPSDVENVSVMIDVTKSLVLQIDASLVA